MLPAAGIALFAAWRRDADLLTLAAFAGAVPAVGFFFWPRQVAFVLRNLPGGAVLDLERRGRWARRTRVPVAEILSLSHEPRARLRGRWLRGLDPRSSFGQRLFTVPWGKVLVLTTADDEYYLAPERPDEFIARLRELQGLDLPG